MFIVQMVYVSYIARFSLIYYYYSLSYSLGNGATIVMSLYKYVII